MTKPRHQPVVLPHEQLDEFRAALQHTQSLTGFNAALIEKDYYCSLSLRYLFAHQDHQLVFKGGTCLNKVYLGFFRLSEDLDFTIPTATDASRSWRRTTIEPIKTLIADLPRQCPYFQLSAPLAGANNSTQYNAEVTYQSAVAQDVGRVKLEIGLRDELLLPAENRPATTMLKDAFKDTTLLPPIAVKCLSFAEAMAEKVRAMLTRRDIAIRDFFDFWHATKTGAISVDDKFLDLVTKKLARSPTGPSPLSQRHIEILGAQLETDLRPVLNHATFSTFSLEEALTSYRSVFSRLPGT